MNMQNLIQQAQKIQREMQKEKEELYETVFKISKNGIVTLEIYGNKTIKAINIEPDALEKDNKEMIETAIKTGLDDIYNAIDQKEVEIEEKYSKTPGGFGF